MTRVVFAHGFTQTGRSWNRIIDGLGDVVPGLDAIAPDLPGHGDADDIRADLWESGSRLVDVGGDGVYVGYSMGGRTALHAAIEHPLRVERLVLIGATAGIDTEQGRADRRESDEALAQRIEATGVAEFLDGWLANPLFAGLSDEAAGRDDRMRNTAAGLASSLRLAGTGTQTPLWNRLNEITAPTLVLVGEHDEKFTALGERLVAGIPRSEIAVIAGSGHSVHLERPAEAVDAIARFLG